MRIFKWKIVRKDHYDGLVEECFNLAKENVNLNIAIAKREKEFNQTIKIYSECIDNISGLFLGDINYQINRCLTGKKMYNENKKD